MDTDMDADQRFLAAIEILRDNSRFETSFEEIVAALTYVVMDEKDADELRKGGGE